MYRRIHTFLQFLHPHHSCRHHHRRRRRHHHHHHHPFLLGLLRPVVAIIHTKQGSLLSFQRSSHIYFFILVDILRCVKKYPVKVYSLSLFFPFCSCNCNHWLWHSFALSKRKFTSMVLSVGFVVDKVALEQIFISFLSDNHYSSNAPHSFVWHVGMDSGFIRGPSPKKCSGISPKE